MPPPVSEAAGRVKGEMWVCGVATRHVCWGVRLSQAPRVLSDMHDIEEVCIVQYKVVVGQETH